MMAKNGGDKSRKMKILRRGGSREMKVLDGDHLIVFVLLVVWATVVHIVFLV